MQQLSNNDEDCDSRTASVGVKKKLSPNTHAGEVESLSLSPSITPESSDLFRVDTTALQDPSTLSSSILTQPPSPSSESARSNMSSGFGNNRLVTGFHKTRAILAQQAAAAATSENTPVTITESPGASADDAIEISDDDASSEGGGMLLNVENRNNHQDHDAMAVDDDKEEESNDEDRDTMSDRESMINGVTPDQTNTQPPSLSNDIDTHMQLQADIGRVAGDATSLPPSALGSTDLKVPRLADLSDADLELQFKYAFFYLPRDQVDLSRPVVCLKCLENGHTNQACPKSTCTHCGSVGDHSAVLCPLVTRCSKCRERGHAVQDCTTGIKNTTIPCEICGSLGHVETACLQRFSLAPLRPLNGRIRLWVSCCLCASKSHYAGDCPGADQTSASRWSLRSIDPHLLTNLSLEPNTGQLEREAGNRGMRPQGLSIKGRAGLHRASKQDAGDDGLENSDDEFIRPKIDTTRRTHAVRGEFSFRHPQRLPTFPSGASVDNYDRYYPSDRRDPQRHRSDWYATDSFGRHRSRSPPLGLSGSRRDDVSQGESYRQRSRSPRGFAGYKPYRGRSRSPRAEAPSPINSANKSGSKGSIQANISTNNTKAAKSRGKRAKKAKPTALSNQS